MTLRSTLSSSRRLPCARRLGTQPYICSKHGLPQASWLESSLRFWLLVTPTTRISWPSYVARPFLRQRWPHLHLRLRQQRWLHRRLLITASWIQEQLAFNKLLNRRPWPAHHPLLVQYTQGHAPLSLSSQLHSLLQHHLQRRCLLRQDRPAWGMFLGLVFFQLAVRPSSVRALAHGRQSTKVARHHPAYLRLRRRELHPDLHRAPALLVARWAL